MGYKKISFEELEEKYGKEFANWAKINYSRIPDKYLRAGCKNTTEYLNKCAKNAGYNSHDNRYKEHRKEYQWNKGTSPISESDNCGLYLGLI